MNIKANRAYYYSLVKTGALDSFDDALLDLVLYVICKKDYNSITLKDLQKDFYDIVGFNLPYFPLENILNKANNKKIIVYNNSKHGYVPNYSLIEKDLIMEKFSNSEKEYDELKNEFILYLKNEKKVTISPQEAENMINCFVEEQGILFFENKDEYCLNPHEEYLFATFLNYLYLTRNESLKFVNDLVVGRILSEMVLYSEDLSEESNFKNMTAYLDTGFVFRLLGVDGIDRKDVYIDLINRMHELGIVTKMYNHSYQEMIRLITNSEQWLQNPDFDAAKSNEATIYFVNNGYKKEDISDYLIKVSNELSKFQIEIDSINYPQSVPMGVTSEHDCYDAIVDYYKEKNANFDEEEKRNTVYFDALSFFFTNYLSQGIASTQWSDVKNIFVTTNRSLPVVARKIVCEKNGTSRYSIPFCVSDSFLGVLLWKNSPELVAEKSYRRLLSAMHSAFMPSNAMLKKLSETVKKCQEEGLLSPDECYFLKTNKEAQKQLMSITQGDVDAFNERTPLEILKEIREEAILEGKAAEREKANIEILNIEEALANEKKMSSEKDNKIIDKEIELIETKRRSEETERQYITSKLADISKSKKRVERKTNTIIFVLAVLILSALILLFSILNDVFQNSEKVNSEIISLAISASIAFLGYLFFAIKEKTFSINEIILRGKRKIEGCFWNKEGKKPNEELELQKKLDQIQENLVEYSNKSNDLLLSRK